MNVTQQFTDLAQPPRTPDHELATDHLNSDDEVEPTPKAQMIATLSGLRSSVNGMLRNIANPQDLAAVFNQLAVSAADLDTLKDLAHLQRPPNQKVLREAGIIRFRLHNIQERGIKLLHQEVNRLATNLLSYNQMNATEKNAFEDYLDILVEAYNSLINVPRNYTPEEGLTVAAIHAVLIFVGNALDAQQPHAPAPQ